MLQIVEFPAFDLSEYNALRQRAVLEHYVSHSDPREIFKYNNGWLWFGAYSEWSVDIDSS